MVAPPVDLLVLAGGRGERLGGRDKARVEVGGRPLLARVLDAAPLLGGRVVVVGDTPVPDGVLLTLEEPPDGGPVAGIAAGLAALRGEAGAGRAAGEGSVDGGGWVAVVAVDQPGAPVALAALRALLASLPDRVDAVAHQDAEGVRQWLLAVYRRRSLEDALDRLGEVRDVSVRRLVADLTWAQAHVGQEHLGDVDTWDDARAWERRLAGDAPRATMTTERPDVEG